MKSKMIALAVLALGVLPMNFAHAEFNLAEFARDSIQLTSLENYLIDWKVGDTMSHNILGGPFGKIGTSVKTVTKDEGETLWLRQEMKLMTQNEVIEIQMSRVDGKILKMIRNGKEEAIPDDKLEIISQEYEEVTVPAGKFNSLHIVAKSQKIKQLDAWMNPQETCMDGGLKQIVDTNMIKLTLELTSFVKVP